MTLHPWRRVVLCIQLRNTACCSLQQYIYIYIYYVLCTFSFAEDTAVLSQKSVGATNCRGRFDHTPMRINYTDCTVYIKITCVYLYMHGIYHIIQVPAISIYRFTVRLQQAQQSITVYGTYTTYKNAPFAILQFIPLPWGGGHRRSNLFCFFYQLL